MFWHLSSSAQLHSSVQTRLFRLQEHLHEHLLVDSTLLDPHMHRMSWRTCLMSMYLLVAMTVACHLALSSKRERFRDDMVNEQELRPRNDVWSHTPRVCGSLSTPWSGFSCLKRCHPRVFVWDLWSCLEQQSEYKNYSHPVTTTTDGSASSPSSISATRTLGLIKEACEVTCNPELLIRSTCYDMPGLCSHWSSSNVWVVLSCVVFTPVCFISPACISLYLCQL